MKTTQTLLLAATLSAGLLAATGSYAALIASADSKTVWDADVNGGVTWLSNANLAATNTFGLARKVDLGGIPVVNTYGGSYIYSYGRMTWGGAMKWIAAMNAANYLCYNNRRLPTSNTCGGSSCTNSEMGHLFYTELGQVAGQSISLSTDPDRVKFSNLQSFYYWSGTEYAPYTYFAWDFNTSYGYQGADGKNNGLFALAVRPGQVVPPRCLAQGCRWVLASLA